MAIRIGIYGYGNLGKGVELAIANDPNGRFVNYDPALLLTLRWPDLPPQAHSLIGKCYWSKDSNGELTIRRDTIHLNIRGEYLQACIWYGFLFNKDPRDIKWVPLDVADSDAAFLRSMAARALKEF